MASMPQRVDARKLKGESRQFNTHLTALHAFPFRGFAASRETNCLQSPRRMTVSRQQKQGAAHNRSRAATTPADSRPRLAKPNTEN